MLAKITKLNQTVPVIKMLPKQIKPKKAKIWHFLFGKQGKFGSYQKITVFLPKKS